MYAYTESPSKNPSHYEWQKAADASISLDVQNGYTIVKASERSMPTPHLLLHFDINRTMIACDKVQAQTPGDVVANTLADHTEGLWDDSLTVPIPYSDYVKDYLLPNPTRSKKVKAKQKAHTSRFVEHLKEIGHPRYAELQEKYDRAMDVLSTQKTTVFPSFYKLVEYLDGKGISYTLVLRTFGGDAEDVADELNEQLGGRFLTDVRTYAKEPFKNQNDFYDFLKSSDHHIAIQDNWDEWYAHNEEGAYGKPFPIDFEDSERLSLFFDDNSRLRKMHPERNIVAPYDIRNGTPVNPEDLINKGLLFPIDTISALTEENYFIDLLERALL